MAVKTGGSGGRTVRETVFENPFQNSLKTKPSKMKTKQSFKGKFGNEATLRIRQALIKIVSKKLIVDFLVGGATPASTFQSCFITVKSNDAGNS